MRSSSSGAAPCRPSASPARSAAGAPSCSRTSKRVRASMRCSPGSATTSSWRPHAADPEPARVGRDGALSLALERRGGATVLSRCRYSLPLQVLAPLALDDRAAVVSVLNPTRGLVGRDRLAIDVVVGPDAHACLTTPSATKVYRTAGATAEQPVRLRLGVGAI